MVRDAAEVLPPALDDGAGVMRRTVLAGAAWSLPVVALAVATPMAAASVTATTFTAVPAASSDPVELPCQMTDLPATSGGDEGDPENTVRLNFCLPDGLMLLAASSSDVTWAVSGDGTLDTWVYNVTATTAGQDQLVVLTLGLTDGTPAQSGTVNALPTIGGDVFDDITWDYVFPGGDGNYVVGCPAVV